jgi:hypothetical protein
VAFSVQHRLQCRPVAVNVGKDECFDGYASRRTTFTLMILSSGT